MRLRDRVSGRHSSRNTNKFTYVPKIESSNLWPTEPISQQTNSLLATNPSPRFNRKSSSMTNKEIKKSRFDYRAVIIGIILISLIFLVARHGFPTNLSIFDVNKAPKQVSEDNVYHISNNKNYEISLDSLFKDEDDNKLYYDAQSTKHLDVKIIGDLLVITPKKDFNGQETVTVKVTDLENTAQLDLTINVLEGQLLVKDYSKLIIDVKDKYSRDVGEITVEPRLDNKFDAVIENKRYRNTAVDIVGGQTDKAVLNAKFDRVADTEITTTVFGIDELEVDNATITLPKFGDVNSVAHCEDFNVDLFLCLSGWKPTDIPFQDHGDYITFVVDHFTAYGGINITNPKQEPQVGDLWTVNFTTNGTFDLNVTPFGGTYFLTDPPDPSIMQGLEFVSLRCGLIDKAIAPITSGIENETEIKTFYAQDYNCDDQTSYFTSREIMPGDHYLNFTFGTNSMVAQNHAACGTVVTSSQTQTSNVTVSGDCIQLNASNIVFDCDGYSITSTAISGLTLGLFSSNVSNITIKNCRIDNFNYSIYVNQTSRSTFLNNNITSPYIGFAALNESNNTISGNIIKINGTGNTGNGWGISITNDNGTNITGNTMNISQNGTYGIAVTNAVLMEISYNAVNISTGSQGRTYSITNFTDSRIIYNNFSLSNAKTSCRGTYLADSTRTNISYNNIFTNCVQGNGIEIEQSTTGSSFIIISYNNVTTTNSSSYGIGLKSNSDNITITNNNIRTIPPLVSGNDDSNGILISTGCIDNNITNNLINTTGTGSTGASSSDDGIELSTAITNTIITGNIIHTNTTASHGITISINPTGSIINSNTIITEGRSSIGIRNVGSSGLTINNNTVSTYGNSSNGISTIVSATVANNTVSTYANNSIGISGGTSNLSNNTIITYSNNSDGLTISSTSRVLSSNITTYGNRSRGFLVTGSNNTFTSDSVASNLSAEFFSTVGVSNTLTNMSLLGRTNITSISFLNISVDIPTSNIPANPSNQYNLSHYLNITNESSGGFINFTHYYSTSDIAGLNESSILMYKYNESTAAWQALTGSAVYEAGDYVWSGNLTSFSIHAPFANISSSTIDVNVSKTSTPDPVNASDNLTYQIILNASLSTPVNVTINESYDSRISFLNSTPNPTTSPNIWIIELNSSINYTINITVSVNSSLTNGTLLTNNVTINYTNTSSLNQIKNASVNTTVTATISSSTTEDPVATVTETGGGGDPPRKRGSNLTIPLPEENPVIFPEVQFPKIIAEWKENLITLWKTWYILFILALVGVILASTIYLVAKKNRKEADENVSANPYANSIRNRIVGIETKLSTLRMEVLHENPEKINQKLSKIDLALYKTKLDLGDTLYAEDYEDFKKIKQIDKKLSLMRKQIDG